MQTTRRPQDLCDIAFSQTVGWEERLRAATELIRDLESLQTVLGAAARTEGASWTSIGDALAVSRQAAQQRLTPKVVREQPSQEKTPPASGSQQKDQAAPSPTQGQVPIPAAAARGAGELEETERVDPRAAWGYTAWVGGVPVVRVERVLERPVSGARRSRWGGRGRRA